MRVPAPGLSWVQESQRRILGLELEYLQDLHKAIDIRPGLILHQDGSRLWPAVSGVACRLT